MKKIVLSIIAMTFAASPLMASVSASAQERPPELRQQQQDRREQRQDRRESRGERRQDGQVRQEPRQEQNQDRRETGQDMRQDRRESRQELRQDRREFRQDRRQDRREFRQELRQDRRQAARPNWLRRGGKYRDGGVYLRDYRRYGLRAPARGQRWVRYGDEYLLVSIASGLIVGIIVSR